MILNTASAGVCSMKTVVTMLPSFTFWAVIKCQYYLMPFHSNLVIPDLRLTVMDNNEEQNISTKAGYLLTCRYFSLGSFWLCTIIFP